MTSRMGSFAAWTGARQALGPGVTPLLPLSNYCVYKNRQGSVSQAKRGAWGPANVRTWQIRAVWERANHLPQNYRYSFLCFSLVSLSELQESSGYHFAPCSPWLASSCFGSKEQNKLRVLLHTLVQACWDLRGWGISFQGSFLGEVTKSFGLKGTRAGQDRPGQTCPLPFALHSQRTVRERKEVL